MKSVRTFLFLLLTMTSLFQAYGVVWRDPKDETIHSSGRITPDKKAQEDFDRKTNQEVGHNQIFYGDAYLEGRTITVSLHQKFKIILGLPDDEENGELTHQYNLIGDARTEAPLQYLPVDTIVGQEGPIELADFYLTGGLHYPKRQRGITMGFFVVPNQVSPPGKPYSLTFRLFDLHMDPNLGQYRTAGFKTITWYVNVEEQTAPAESSKAQ